MTSIYAFDPTIWPSLITALFLLMLAVYSWRRRSLPGTVPLMVGCLFGAAWAFASVMEDAALDVTTKIEWAKIQAVFELPIPTAITCFFLEYAWPGRWLTRRNLVLFTLPCLLALVSALTNDLNHLTWKGFSYDGIIYPLPGPITWVVIGYAFLGLGLLNLVIFTWLFKRSPQQRWPVVLILAGQVTGRTLYLLGVAQVFSPVLHIKLLGMAFEFLVYAIVLFGFRILDPILMAQRVVIEQLNAGMLVLDLKGKIVSLNPAAERILTTSVKIARDKPIEELLPIGSLKSWDGSAFSETEICLGTGHEPRDYLLDTSPLIDWRGLEAGHLLMLRDVTEQKRSQSQIIEQQRSLARAQEREILARDLHDQLSQDLAFINVETQAICDLLAAGQVEQAGTDLQRLAKIAREAQVDVRGQITRLSLDALSKEGFTGALHQFVHSFWSMYGIQALLCLDQCPNEYHLKPAVEVQLLRIVQEAFANIRKHANARNVRISLGNLPGWIELSIEDDGLGFDPAQCAERTTFGLRIMSERATEMGGNLLVQSEPGRGTKVVVRVPVSGEKEAR